MERIPQRLLQLPIDGQNLSGETLQDELGQTPQLLVFVRHFGCIFCREMIGDLRKLSEQDPEYPPVLIFYQGTVREGDAFFRKHWPDARAIADKPKTFYEGLGLARGDVKEMFGPGVWTCGVRAALKGHFVGKPVGDPWEMPGVFLVQGERILWQHDFKHAGDHPDFTIMPRLVREYADLAATPS